MPAYTEFLLTPVYAYLYAWFAFLLLALVKLVSDVWISLAPTHDTSTWPV